MQDRKAGQRASCAWTRTNERYFAQRVRKELGAMVPVECVVASETIERPGANPMTMKQFMAGCWLAELDDNHLLLPPEQSVREDWRLVKKEKGQPVCEPDANGKHGDTFDSAKQSVYALMPSGIATMPVAFGR